MGGRALIDDLQHNPPEGRTFGSPLQQEKRRAGRHAARGSRDASEPVVSHFHGILMLPRAHSIAQAAWKFFV